ncbi:hypothetical protein LTR08_002285 [Meristemomyces frigidus]|nr:hypothetical protein LTR08_002285 [Meristemomyces frigidus]
MESYDFGGPRPLTDSAGGLRACAPPMDSYDFDYGYTNHLAPHNQSRIVASASQRDQAGDVDLWPYGEFDDLPLFDVSELLNLPAYQYEDKQYGYAQHHVSSAPGVPMAPKQLPALQTHGALQRTSTPLTDTVKQLNTASSRNSSTQATPAYPGQNPRQVPAVARSKKQNSITVAKSMTKCRCVCGCKKTYFQRGYESGNCSKCEKNKDGTCSSVSTANATSPLAARSFATPMANTNGQQQSFAHQPSIAQLHDMQSFSTVALGGGETVVDDEKHQSVSKTLRNGLPHLKREGGASAADDKHPKAHEGPTKTVASTADGLHPKKNTADDVYLSNAPVYRPHFASKKEADDHLAGR